MHRSCATLLLLPLLACGGGIDGTWEGECVYDDDNGVELNLTLEASGGDASGSVIGAFDTLGYLYIRNGDIFGDASSGSVDLNLEFEDGVDLQVTGERDGDIIVGTCEGDGVSGELELERG